MKVSLVICTWNRARLLDQTLTGLRILQIPDGVAWEVLVVNNNCTDTTDEVIARHGKHLPLRRLFEPKAGKSQAANLALMEAAGDLLVWTDDDVLVNPDWLEHYVKAAQDWPDAAFFAGAIDPCFEKEPPRWIRRHLARLKGVFVIVDYGDTARPLCPADGVFGANMAFRLPLAKQFPLNVHSGRIRDALVGGDDTELVNRVTQAGYHGMWVPSARLRHFVPAERMTKSYIWKWFHGSGQNIVRQGGIANCTFLWDAPRWAIRRYYIELAKSWLYSPLKGPNWFEAFVQSARFRGIIDESRAKQRAKRTETFLFENGSSAEVGTDPSKESS